MTLLEVARTGRLGSVLPITVSETRGSAGSLRSQRDRQARSASGHALNVPGISSKPLQSDGRRGKRASVIIQAQSAIKVGLKLAALTLDDDTMGVAYARALTRRQFYSGLLAGMAIRWAFTGIRFAAVKAN